jgi:hypothetical protein
MKDVGPPENQRQPNRSSFLKPSMWDSTACCRLLKAVVCCKDGFQRLVFSILLGTRGCKNVSQVFVACAYKHSRRRV